MKTINLMMEDVLNRCVGEVVQISCGPCTITGKLNAGTLSTCVKGPCSFYYTIDRDQEQDNSGYGGGDVTFHANSVRDIIMENHTHNNVTVKIHLHNAPISNY